MFDNIEEYLVAFLRAFVDGIEDFFSIITYPTRKIIETALFICFGLFLFSVAGMLFEIPTLISWQEALAGLIMLLLIYFADFISMHDINKVKKIAEKNVSKITQTMKASAVNVKRNAIKSSRKRTKGKR